MRYLMTPQELRFFAQHGVLELDPLFTSDDFEVVEEALKLHPSGRDLFRYSDKARKILCSKKLGSIASSLFNATPLMIAFTQYPTAIEPETTLDAICSFNDLAGGLLLNLEQTIFVAPSTPLPAFQGVLIGYGTVSTRYRINERDPSGQELKKLGYGSGDRLTSETHPIVSRA